MKKMLCCLMTAVLLLCSVMPQMVSRAEEEEQCVSGRIDYVNANGEIITIVTQSDEIQSIASVYVNGILQQKSVLDVINNTILTKIYDGLDVSSEDSKQHESNGFLITTVHEMISEERISVDGETSTKVLAASRSSRSIYDEPVDNSGLTSSGYGDGYYYLGSSTYGNYLQGVSGYLYRKYTSTYDGLTYSWTWGPSDTLSAISAVISAAGGPVGVIVGLLVFGAGEYLAYTQSVKLDTYTFNYNYRVRVKGGVYFETIRNITYWKIIKDGGVTYSQKRFNYGFSPNNGEMIIAALQNYEESH